MVDGRTGLQELTYPNGPGRPMSRDVIGPGLKIGPLPYSDVIARIIVYPFCEIVRLQVATISEACYVIS